MAGVEAGQWGGLDLLGVLGVRLRALVNFSHIHFYTNFAAKITANRLVSTQIRNNIIGIV